MPRRVQDIIPSDRRSIRNVDLEPAHHEHRKETTETTAKRKHKSSAETSDSDKKKNDVLRQQGELEVGALAEGRKGSKWRELSQESNTEAPQDRAMEGRMVSLRRLPLTPPLPPTPKKIGSSRLWRNIAIGAVLLIVVVASAWAGSTYFSRATFTLIARTVQVSVNTTVVASATSTPGYLQYQIVPVTGSVTATIPASGNSYVSTKAVGSITLYNAYSNQAQRLIAGTRLAAPNGLIYRLTGSVTVPGYSGSSANLVPGNLKAAVVADQPGVQYNLALSQANVNWKLPAFLGTPRYAGFYAKPASAMTGGFLGMQKSVDPQVLASTTATLAAKLTSQLINEASSSIPSGMIMYANAYTTAFAPASILSVNASSSNSATISETGTLYAITFRKTDLTAALAGDSSISSFGSFPYETIGLDSLTFSITNPEDFSPAAKNTLIAHFSGPLELEGEVPVADIRAKLAGARFADTGSILNPYRPVIDIQNSSGELVPPWISTVPADQSRISIVVKGG